MPLKGFNEFNRLLMIAMNFCLIMLRGLMEIPAYTLVVPLVSKYGRRPSTAASFVLTGICMIALSLTPGSNNEI